MTCLDRQKDFRWTVLLQPLQRINDGFIVIDPECDYLLMGIKVAHRSQVLYRVSDSRGFFTSNTRLRATEFPNAVAATPFGRGVGMFAKVFVPEVLVPKGGKINIELEETGNVGPFLFKIVFVGRKVFRAC